MNATLQAFFLFLSLSFDSINCLRPLSNRVAGYHDKHRFDRKANHGMTTINDAITVPKSYNVAIGSIATSVALTFGAHNILAGIPFGLLGILLIVQTGKVRFVFDEEAMEVFVAKKDEKGEEINASRENFVVGGKNRWKYSTFTEWFFIPSKNFPILMYFKENQTSPQGQVHLFPVIMDGRVLFDCLTENVGSLTPAKE